MPIHVRAEPGDYAEACLLPGDPLRAQYIAETYFDDAVQRNDERGMLGYTGTWEGKPISVQATGMGCPSAAIVMEELVQLGVKRFLRVGTCGGLQPDMQLGDMIVALSAVPADRTVETYVDHEPHCPTASWELVHGAVHAAKEIGQAMRVGPIVSSDVFYNPDAGQYERWSKRGVLAVEMEAAVLFTIGALRDVQARLPADGQRRRRRGRVQADHRRRAARGRRPHDPRRAGDGDGQPPLRRPSSSSTPRRDNGATGRRWPQIANAAASRGLSGDTLLLGTARPPRSARARSGGATAPSCSSSSAGTAPSTRS